MDCRQGEISNGKVPRIKETNGEDVVSAASILCIYFNNCVARLVRERTTQLGRDHRCSECCENVWGGERRSREAFEYQNTDALPHPTRSHFDVFFVTSHNKNRRRIRSPMTTHAPATALSPAPARSSFRSSKKAPRTLSPSATTINNTNDLNSNSDNEAVSGGDNKATNSHVNVKQRKTHGKCRKVLGIAQIKLWCRPCQWKKSCIRYSGGDSGTSTTSSSSSSKKSPKSSVS